MERRGAPCLHAASAREHASSRGGTTCQKLPIALDRLGLVAVFGAAARRPRVLFHPGRFAAGGAPLHPPRCPHPRHCSRRPGLSPRPCRNRLAACVARANRRETVPLGAARRQRIPLEHHKSPCAVCARRRLRVSKYRGKVCCYWARTRHELEAFPQAFPQVYAKGHRKGGRELVRAQRWGRARGGRTQSGAAAQTPWSFSCAGAAAAPGRNGWTDRQTGGGPPRRRLAPAPRCREPPRGAWARAGGPREWLV